jgi:predicted ATPase
LDRALTGDGGVGLVVGEPGIGKSSLLEQISAAARDRGFEVAWGRAWELGGAPAYWPWIESLRALPPSRKLEPLITELEGRGSGEENHRDAFQLCARVSRFLEEATERAPLLLVFDDLHAADPSSLEL